MLNKNFLPKMLNKNVTQKAFPVWPMANDPLCIACRFWARLQPIFSSTGSWRKIEKNKTNWENWTICKQIGSSCVLMSKSICEMWSLVQVKVKVVKVAKSEVADSGRQLPIKCWLFTFHCCCCCVTVHIQQYCSCSRINRYDKTHSAIWFLWGNMEN